MTAKERKTLKDVTNNEEAFNTFINLYRRWEDEWQYENFEDYAQMMFKYAPKSATFVRGTENPFGVVFLYGGLEVTIYLKIVRGLGCLVWKA